MRGVAGVSVQLFRLEAAYAYEILIRKQFPDLIPLAWPQLEATWTNKFAKHFPIRDPRQPPITEGASVIATGEEIDDPRFTGYCNMAFNLYNDDRTLARYFIEQFVTPQRLEKQIPNPRPNQFRRYRRFSWRPVELLDLRRFGIRQLNNSETSQLSKDERAVVEAAKSEGRSPSDRYSPDR